jgi:branched-chain amino acid transport system substrate-binding protein
MGNQVEKAVTEGRRMILEEKIKFVTVGIHSGAAVAVGNLGKEYKALVIGGFATTKRLTGEVGHPYVGRANLSTIEIGRVIAAYLKDQPQVKRVATIAPDYEFGRQFTEDFVAAIKVARPDIVIVRQEWPKFGATDFAAHVTALQSQPVDMVVAGTFGADLTNFLRAARDFGLFNDKTRLFVHGLDLAKMGALKDSLPPNTVGTIWYPFYAIDTPKSKQFAADMEKRMKTYPTGSAPVGYVAGRMLIEAIKKAGTADDVDKVVQAMGTVQFDGPTGNTKVRGCDNMALYNFYVGTVKRDAKLPDGIGVGDVKAFNVESVIRPCVEVLRLRGTT